MKHNLQRFCKENMQKYYPWGALLLLAMAMIILPAAACRKDNTSEQPQKRSAWRRNRGKASNASKQGIKQPDKKSNSRKQSKKGSKNTDSAVSPWARLE